MIKKINRDGVVGILVAFLMCLAANAQAMDDDKGAAVESLVADTNLIKSAVSHLEPLNTVSRASSFQSTSSCKARPSFTPKFSDGSFFGASLDTIDAFKSQSQDAQETKKKKPKKKKPFLRGPQMAAKAFNLKSRPKPPEKPESIFVLKEVVDEDGYVISVPEYRYFQSSSSSDHRSSDD